MAPLLRPHNTYIWKVFTFLFTTTTSTNFWPFYSKHLKHLLCTHLHISSLHVTIIDLINVFSTWLASKVFNKFLKFKNKKKETIKMDVHDFDDNASMMSSSTMATSAVTGQVWNHFNFWLVRIRANFKKFDVILGTSSHLYCVAKLCWSRTAATMPFWSCPYYSGNYLLSEGEL